jgi:hypothetical protein
MLPDYTWELAMANMKDVSVSTKEIPPAISDTGQVRIGNASPAFPVMRPLVRGKPITISDTGEVQTGDYSAAVGSGTTAYEPHIRIARRR